jgi:hypothetical protein
MGPNTLSGHLSVLYTTECQINFIVRIIRPILNGLNRSLLPSLLRIKCPDSVAVTSMAERKDVSMTDHKAKQLVWATGCTSWFIDPSTGRNTIMFPDWQFKFHLRSIFIPWADFVYKKSPKGSPREVAVVPQYFLSVAAGSIVLVGALLGLYSLGSFKSSTLAALQQYVSKFLHGLYRLGFSVLHLRRRKEN